MIELLTQYGDYIRWYIFISMLFPILNAYIAGLIDSRLDKQTVWDSFLWPLSMATFLGTLTKGIIDAVRK